MRQEPSTAGAEQSTGPRSSNGSRASAGNAATLREIAEACGVSVRTVSRILKGTFKGTWPSMKQRAETVRQKAARMGYLPNAAARAMRTGRHACIGLVIGTDRNRSNLPQALLAGIHDELAAQNIHMILSRLPDSALESERRVPRLLEELVVDGLLIDYTHDVPPGFVGLVREHELPAIWINTKQKEDCVFPDDIGAGKIAAEHLLQLGHRRIAFVSSVAESGHHSVGDRRRGYEKAMRSAGLRPIVDVAGDVFRHSAESLEAYLRLMRQPGRPTAAIAYEAVDAGLLVRAADLSGLRMPQDLSIVSIGGRMLESLGLLCTTVLIPDFDVGREAARLILRKAESPAVPLKPVRVPPTLGTGPTTTKPGGE